MARARSAAGNLGSIQAERAELEAKLKALADRERVALETVKDAGRENLLNALEKIKIGAITRQDARAIAAAITRMGGAACAALLTESSSANESVQS